MKRVIIVHCWDGYPEYCWYPNTKKELEAKGFSVEVPEMPKTHTPKLSLWLPQLKETIGKPDENLYLIGHSAGSVTILRYLEQLNDSQKIGGAVLVAGFTDDLGYKELENFFENPVDFKKIKPKAKRFAAIHSDNDPFVPLRYGEILRKNLGGQLLVKNNMGHFSGEADNSKSIIDLPDVVSLLQQWQAGK